MLRKPDEQIIVPDIEPQVLHGHILRCELVTPLYGGGIEVP